MCVCVCVKGVWAGGVWLGGVSEAGGGGGVGCQSPGSKLVKHLGLCHVSTLNKQLRPFRNRNLKNFPGFLQGMWETCLSLPFKMPHTLQTSETP